MCALAGIMLKLYCSYMCLLIYFFYSIPYKIMLIVLLFLSYSLEEFCFIEKMFFKDLTN